MGLGRAPAGYRTWGLTAPSRAAHPDVDHLRPARHVRPVRPLRSLVLTLLPFSVACGDQADGGETDPAAPTTGNVASTGPASATTSSTPTGASTSMPGSSGETSSSEGSGLTTTTDDTTGETESGPTNCVDTSTFDLEGFKATTGRRPFTPPAVVGMTRVASSRAEFDTALAASVDGDAIEITGGPHAWGVVTIANTGLTVFGGTLTGDTAFDIQGDGNTLHSLRFESMTFNPSPAVDSFLSSAIIYFKDGADDNRVLNCEWDAIGAGGNQYAIITTAANNLEIADCDVSNVPKGSFGFAVNGGTPGGGTGYHIHHNDFQGGAKHTPAQGGTPIRIGLLGNDSQATVEYNCILDWANDNETIENKGSNSIIRFNYLDDNGPDSFLSNRVGHSNVFYGNYVGDASLGIYDNGSDNIYVYNLFERHPSPAFGDIAVSLFAQTPGMPPDAPLEPGSKGGQIERNVFDGFTFWLATVQQFGEVTVGPMGAALSDNVFVGTQGVDTQQNYIPDGGAVDVPFETWVAQNTSANAELSRGRGPVYCGPDGFDFDGIVLGGQEYAAPQWWAQRRGP